MALQVMKRMKKMKRKIQKKMNGRTFCPKPRKPETKAPPIWQIADCQAALELADKSKRLTKTAKKESEDLLNAMGKKTKALKDLLAKKDQWGSLAKAKALLVDAANQMKRTKEEAKELNQLANKTNSKASKK